MRPDIGEMFEGLSGRALRRDLETMFQLIYLTFTQPRADPEAFRAMTGQLSAVAGQSAGAAGCGVRRRAERRGEPEPPPGAAADRRISIAQMNLDKSLAFYKDRFADASDFTFVFVGSFDPATIKPLVERYLGSLPALKRKEAGRDVGIRPPAGVVEKEVTNGRPRRRARSASSSAGRSRTTTRTGSSIRAMANTLAGNLQRVLREDLGGTYGVSVVPEFTKRPTEEYRVTISFACDPARTQDLVKALFAVVEDFKTTGPSAGQVADAAGRPAAGSRDRQPAEWLRAESARVGLPVRRAASGSDDASCRLRWNHAVGPA